MKLIKRTLLTASALLLMSMNTYSAEMNIGVIDQQLALFGTNYAAKEFEELQNSEEFKEVQEERQAKINEAQELQEKGQKDGPTMSDEEKQEMGLKLQSLSQDIKFLNEKTNQFINQSRQLILQAQGEKYSLVVTELIRAKGITLLLYGGQESQVGYHDQSYDITQDVIDAMNEKED